MGYHIWLGLSHDVRAIRPYGSIANIWNMVARTAYTQLRYSPIWLITCTLLMVIGYIVPFLAIISAPFPLKALGLISLLAIYASYYPTIRYYQLSPAWTFTLPLAGVLFLAMTWTSAIRFWRGEKSRWKNRSYEAA